jgi:hypothetical protein
VVGFGSDKPCEFVHVGQGEAIDGTLAWFWHDAQTVCQLLVCEGVFQD